MSNTPQTLRYDYLSSVSPEYVDELFKMYLRDPASVDSTWRYFFDGIELAETLPAHAPYTNGHATSSTSSALDARAEGNVSQLISLYRSKGWLVAQLNPLDQSPVGTHPLLSLSSFGLSEKDLDRVFEAGRLVGLGPAKLRDILSFLKDTYCSTIGVQYTHVASAEEREWLQGQMEAQRNREPLSMDAKKNLLKRLTESETFENFIHTRYVGQKRFSIEGGEGLLPMLDRMILEGAELGAEQFVMGMAHRGRLNILVNLYGKHAKYIFTEFEQAYERDVNDGEGDVKYHMGYSSDITTAQGKSVHLSLAYNPSHLEFVNPVVEGIARGKQRFLGDKKRERVIPILIHGDAAVAGQGVVYETLNLSQVDGYTTGGTIHIVINNQIGFTAEPYESRSTTHCTDIAMMLEIPIFHVNGDDPEAASWVAKLAMEYRQKFKKDVFIDLICYRRYGHNEGDEPAFTQPLMYNTIKSHPTPRKFYAQKLVAQSIISASEADGMVETEMQRWGDVQELTKKERPKPYVSAYQSVWNRFKKASDQDLKKKVETAVQEETLKRFGLKANGFPADFSLHPKLSRLFETRCKSIQDGTGLDWGTGESLALATLLAEGHTVRISRQDSERGTFSHRNSVLHDIKTGKKFSPYHHLDQKQGDFIVINSVLSECAVLGFEYGWSLADPNALVIWEAQFGDFANGAQVIIDQFIASGEAKWQRASGIVLLLPHGYEGQGPEHSSGRLERFLQLAGKDSMSVCNLTTPAQLFHALRRQMKRDFRKPLVVMTPKSLLRHPKAVSDLSEFSRGQFQPVIPDLTVAKAQVDRILLASGKIYYDLIAAREEKKIQRAAILRIEELYPWPADLLAETLKQYPEKAEICWVQEEPANMGAWMHILYAWCDPSQNFRDRAGGRMIRYIGRDRSATPAVGSLKVHLEEQKRIVETALHFA